MSGNIDFKKLPIGGTSWQVGITRALAVMMWLLALTGLGLRFSVRDRFQPWAVLYYMTPIPVLALLFLLAGWSSSPQKRLQQAGEVRSSWRTLRRFSLLAGSLCGVWTWWAEFPLAARPAPADSIELVFWNVGHCRLGAKRIAEQIRYWDVPIVALVEVSMKDKSPEEFWRAQLPDYTTAIISKDRLLAVKGEVVSQRGHRLSTLSRCDQFDIRLDGREITVLIVDVASNLFVSRQEAIAKLATIVAELKDQPVIIVGDFNTPDDSVWFKPLREQARSGVRSAGSGYAATWPNPLPVLTLDQVWLNDRCNTYSCRVGWTLLSDHRPLFATFRIAPGANSDEETPLPNLQ